MGQIAVTAKSDIVRYVHILAWDHLLAARTDRRGRHSGKQFINKLHSSKALTTAKAVPVWRNVPRVQRPQQICLYPMNY